MEQLTFAKTLYELELGKTSSNKSEWKIASPL